MAVKRPHFLLASGNIPQMRENLASTVGPEAIKAIDRELRKNVKKLFRLGRGHLEFACAQSHHWRQCVSRLYYAAYNVSRAVRLSDSGQYSQKPEDHEKVGELPRDFPERERFGNLLRALRTDRNLCDYDHEAVPGDLTLQVEAWSKFGQEFVEVASTFLRRKGVRL